MRPGTREKKREERHESACYEAVWAMEEFGRGVILRLVDVAPAPNLQTTPCETIHTPPKGPPSIAALPDTRFEAFFTVSGLTFH
jgi:hypothetical protein